MAWLGGESLEDALVARMAAADAAKVSALNTELGDDPVIVEPVEWVTYAEPESLQHWPTGFVVIRREEADQRNMTLGGAGHQDLSMTLWCGVFIRAATQDQKRLMHRSLLRYGRMLRELIAEESGDATILGAGYNIDTPRVEYPDRGVLASGQMFGVVYAEFTATITEGRT